MRACRHVCICVHLFYFYSFSHAHYAYSSIGCAVAPSSAPPSTLCASGGANTSHCRRRSFLRLKGQRPQCSVCGCGCLEHCTRTQENMHLKQITLLIYITYSSNFVHVSSERRADEPTWGSGRATTKNEELRPQRNTQYTSHYTAQRCFLATSTPLFIVCFLPSCDQLRMRCQQSLHLLPVSHLSQLHCISAPRVANSHVYHALTFHRLICQQCAHQ